MYVYTRIRHQKQFLVERRFNNRSQHATARIINVEASSTPYPWSVQILRTNMDAVAQEDESAGCTGSLISTSGY